MAFVVSDGDLPPGQYRSPFTPDSKPGSGSTFAPPPGGSGTTIPPVPLSDASEEDASSEKDESLPEADESLEDASPEEPTPPSTWGALGATLPSVFTTNARVFCAVSWKLPPGRTVRVIPVPVTAAVTE